jgi:hypothetical protein
VVLVMVTVGSRERRRERIVVDVSDRDGGSEGDR